jgi:hypothetical protein
MRSASPAFATVSRRKGSRRNPVIVSPFEDRYLVLDGAHRVRVSRS